MLEDKVYLTVPVYELFKKLRLYKYRIYHPRPMKCKYNSYTNLFLFFKKISPNYKIETKHFQQFIGKIVTLLNFIEFCNYFA